MTKIRIKRKLKTKVVVYVFTAIEVNRRDATRKKWKLLVV